MWLVGRAAAGHRAFQDALVAQIPVHGADHREEFLPQPMKSPLKCLKSPRNSHKWPLSEAF